MFAIGEYIIYGANGVCEVLDIKEQQDELTHNTRLYYVLSPVYRRNSLIYTPVDNARVIMRPIIKRSEAEALIDRILNIPTIEVQDEKSRKQFYTDIIRTYDPENLIRILKTIQVRKQLRMSMGKKMLSSDDNFMQKAEELLYGEMAWSLEISRDEVEEYIIKRVSEKV